MLYDILSVLWPVAIIAVTIYIYRGIHRAALDRNRLLYELKEEVRKLRKSQEPDRDAETSKRS